jgi:hypothetical protein
MPELSLFASDMSLDSLKRRDPATSDVEVDTSFEHQETEPTDLDSSSPGKAEDEYVGDLSGFRVHPIRAWRGHLVLRSW